MDDEFRYWRYSSELSVVDAALLTVGLNPGWVTLVGPCIEEAGLLKSTPDENLYFAEHDFRAVFKAMRTAILNDELRARFSRFARKPHTVRSGDGEFEVPNLSGEDEVNYSYVLRSANLTYLTDENVKYLLAGKFYLVKEPDWSNTTVSVADLKEWFKEKNDRPPFFFPQGQREGFQNPDNSRYAPKLAAVVDAWNNVRSPLANKSVKQSLEKWLREHAADYGLVDEDGMPQNDVISDLAKVANWNPKGGAPKTSAPISSDETSEEWSNYCSFEDDSDIPF